MIKLSRGRRITLLVLVGLEVAVMFSGCTLANKILLYPTTQPMESPGARRTFILFETGQIECIIARSPGCAGRDPEAVVLSFTGNAGRAEHVAFPEALEFGNLSIELWAPNHPGFGQSSPPAELKRYAPAALASYDALAKAHPGKPIFIRGTSLGSSMAFHVAANRPVAGMIIRTPPPLRRLIMQGHGWWNLWLLAGPVALGVPSELNALDTVPTIKAPAIFLFIKNDTVVPVKYQRLVAEAYAGPTKQLTMQGDHNDLMDDATEREFESALQWLWKARQSPQTQPNR